jgi:hypothetical protein
MTLGPFSLVRLFAVIGAPRIAASEAISVDRGLPIKGTFPRIPDFCDGWVARRRRSGQMTKPWRRWTEDDIAKLRAMAKKYPIAEIAQELGRQVPAIQTKAHELGISLRRSASPQTMNASAMDPTG